MSFESLHITKLRRSYTEEMIINIFWQNFLGKVYRVDFETIMTNDVIDLEYQNAFIYIDKSSNWDKEVIKSINENGCFILHHTTFYGKNECFTMYKNLNPIPKATTSKNIHQLENINTLLNEQLIILEEENKKLKNQLYNLLK
jgi:hypothetical protein